MVKIDDGLIVGEIVGFVEGEFDGVMVGFVVGDLNGLEVGDSVGMIEGVRVGSVVGVDVGFLNGGGTLAGQLPEQPKEWECHGVASMVWNWMHG